MELESYCASANSEDIVVGSEDGRSDKVQVSCFTNTYVGTAAPILRLTAVDFPFRRASHFDLYRPGS